MVTKTTIPTLEDIQGAANRIRGKVLRTPLIYSEPLSEFVDNEIYLKLECLQPGGAFKYRGATNAITLLSEEQRKAGIVTASSGNHGIAVALAAGKAGVKATIIVPKNAPQVKVDRIRKYGATVIQYGDSYGDSEEKAWELAKEGHFFLHPFDIPEVVAGQGTIGLELDNEAPRELESVLVPVGGGGLIAGVTLGMRYTRPHVKIIGIEPENGASLTAALKAGKPVPIEPKPTCADGLQPRFMGKISFEVCRDGPSPVLISENDLLKAVKYCLDELKLVVEPSGAAGVAALLSNKYEPSGTTAIIISGSNLDRKWLKKALEL